MEENLRLHIRKHPEIETVDLNEVFAVEEQGNNDTNTTEMAPRKPGNTTSNATESAQKIFSCEICEGKFFTEGFLNYHIQDCHGGEQFVSKVLYDFPLKLHETPDLPLYRDTHPEESENMITSATEPAVRPDLKEDLSLHSIHEQHEEPENTITDATKTTVKIFSCKLCDRSFSTRSKRNYHIRDYHKRERFECDQCSRKFVSKALCDIHLEYHKRPDSNGYVCKTCNLVYHSSNGLKHHYDSKHTSYDQRPYECNVCSRRFTSKHMLLNHMRIHNKETV